MIDLAESDLFVDPVKISREIVAPAHPRPLVSSSQFFAGSAEIGVLETSDRWK